MLIGDTGLKTIFLKRSGTFINTFVIDNNIYFVDPSNNKMQQNKI